MRDFSIETVLAHYGILSLKVEGAQDEYGNPVISYSDSLVFCRYAVNTDEDRAANEREESVNTKDRKADIFVYVQPDIDVNIDDLMKDFFFGIYRGVISNYESFLSSKTNKDTNIYKVIKVEEQFDEENLHHKKVHLKRNY